MGGGGGGGVEIKWAWKAEIGVVEFLIAHKACKAIFWPTLGLNEDLTLHPWNLNVTWWEGEHKWADVVEWLQHCILRPGVSLNQGTLVKLLHYSILSPN